MLSLYIRYIRWHCKKSHSNNIFRISCKLHPHSPSPLLPTLHPSPSPPMGPSHHIQHYYTLLPSPHHDYDTWTSTHAVCGHYLTLDWVDGQCDQMGVWWLLLHCNMCLTCSWWAHTMCCAVSNDGAELVIDKSLTSLPSSTSWVTWICFSSWGSLLFHHIF